ncbi:exodeoxyribonuclease V subunit beta [Pigmentiphaga kullae]|uniref:RecBCD enzyme subunit RecB n=1 Tax=Pigmentiphaga kullae TaxID=151784 RepID=A0A4Q7NE62_9BURK|nr:exodeoxyribonuclease V subunit beta [Pigmentiphaga kullae]RZS80987.1 DNA helicase/exodeoxyribonuclease V beta subunit [Pigmentiphaga kullae]
MNLVQTFDPGEDLALTLPLRGSRLIEASAGTGKTFTISALFVRLVLGHGGEQAGFGRELLPPEILVVTFTDAATQELRDRIRSRLALAARYFRGEIDAPDELVATLREHYDAQRWAECAGKLDIAAQWMDEAAVSTIHGWCQRMLREHAFDSGSLFTQTLETDHTGLLAEVVRDYWRQHCYPLRGAALEWAQAHWGTPDGLRGRLAGLLAHAAPAQVERPLHELLDAALDERQARLATLKAPWPAWVAELRQLCDEACAGKRVNARKFQPRWYNPWFDKLLAWAGDSTQEKLDLEKGFERLTPAYMAEVCHPGHVIDHPALHAMAGLKQQLDALPSAQAAMLAHAAGWVRARFDAEKRRRAEMGFDDMLDNLDAALHGENGERLAQVIRTQFPVALIDEFQDTDTVQYRIFDRIYQIADRRDDCALLMIGDPKQAIYAFRGADIYTYLRARRATEGRHYTLGTNYRSSRDMVDAVNRLFMAAERREPGRGAFLFRRASDNPLPFLPVRANGRAERFVASGEPSPALTFWFAEQDTPMGAGAYRAEMAAGCAGQIVRMLEEGAAGRMGFERGGRIRGLRQADIAVLVRDMGEAHAIRTALARRGVRSVYLSDKDSVFAGAEAADTLLWLQACAEPDDDRKLRAALASATLALPLAELDRVNRDERIWEEWVLRFRGYRDRWRSQGVLPMLRRLMDDFGLPGALARRTDGERVLTNLLHLAEILQQAAGELDGEQALIRHLAGHLGQEGQTAEAQILRLESDEQLVKVVTVHKSKGLEYPLVFLPFSCSFRPADRSRPPLRYHDEQGGLVVSIAPDADEEVLADQERLAEDLRLLYVALTRARHACWLGVADLRPGRSGGSSWHRCALGYLLGGGAELAASRDLVGLLQAEAGDLDHVRVEPLPAPGDGVFRTERPAMARPRYRMPQRRTGEPWWIASYSALRIASQAVDDAGPAAAGRHGDLSPETPEDQKLFDDDAGDIDEGQTAQVSTGNGMHRFPRGPGPGTFLHGLFEWAGEEGFADVAGDDRRILDAVARRCNRRGWEAWITPLARWLSALLNDDLPLGPRGAAFRLAGLTSYQVEMEFWFESRHADVRHIDALVRRHVLDDAPRPALEPALLNGMFKGFMDLAFEHEGRYYVADYKSNWLGTSDAAYTMEAMRGEILAKRYDLQYVLYLLALHRQLALRLPDYDYDRHMGGAVYLFLRGSRAPTRGVFFDRPPRELIEALDRLFAGTPQPAEAGR